jgi:hypothetical protein
MRRLQVLVIGIILIEILNVLMSIIGIFKFITVE